MKYRALGHSGLFLSTVGLGSWLTYGGSVDKTTARQCVLRAYERGVNFFDTANVYMRGAAEEVLAPVLGELQRDAIVVATKVYFPMGDSPTERGLSRKHIRDQIHSSLRRLALDYVDLYQCHRYDTTTPVEETCEMMNDLVREGKVLYWGVSEWNADQIASAVNLARAHGWAVPVSNQPQYSALWRRIEARVLPACESYGLGNVVWSPLAMGILTGKYTDAANPPKGTRAAGTAKEMMEDYFTQPVLDAVARLQPLAQRAGCSMAQLALSWCLRQPAVTSVIVGATKVEHVDDNVAAADLGVDPNIFVEMDRILEPVAPHEPYVS
ncbi:MAG: aldo/keto reductase family protein [Candidatus Eremiobacteraeota bacterium]|nr:aldo/keto reductase family protein [Candidatus Eremiobacteraeota bacterium]